jgi:hypothetical protein
MRTRFIDGYDEMWCQQVTSETLVARYIGDLFAVVNELSFKHILVTFNAVQHPDRMVLDRNPLVWIDIEVGALWAWSRWAIIWLDNRFGWG